MWINPKPWLKTNVVPDLVVCRKCGLVKEINGYGMAVWPEPWAKHKTFVDKHFKATKEVCPECVDKETL